MPLYPIYINYDLDTHPIGFVDVNEDLVSPSVIANGAIIPLVVVADDNPEAYYTRCFGLVARKNVDTKREYIGLPEKKE
jgi:hypothetical protein